MPVRSLVAFAVLTLALGWARPAQAQRVQVADRAADAHLERATKMFADGDYRAAIEELRAGYVISPQPRFLYALGQAYRFDHQCGEAVRAYRQFLTYHPARNQVTATETGIKACADADPSSVAATQAEPPAEPPPPPPPSPSPPVVSPAPMPTALVPAVVAQRPARRPVYKRWWPWTILGVAVVGVGVGIGLGVGLTRSSSHFPATIPAIGPGAP